MLKILCLESVIILGLIRHKQAVHKINTSRDLVTSKLGIRRHSLHQASCGLLSKVR